MNHGNSSVLYLFLLYLNILQHTVHEKFAIFAYTQKHNTKDILQAIKGWHSATTYITPKKIKKTHKNQHEMIVHLNQKLREEEKLLQFAKIRIF